MKAHYELQVFQDMNPQATVKLDGKQLYWETENGKRQHSITYYETQEELDRAKRIAFGMNDVMILGNYRFASTYTP